jgi:hypothetical protein
LLLLTNTFKPVTVGGIITMETSNGRNTFSLGNVQTPTRVKASLASIPVGTEASTTKPIPASRELFMVYLVFVVKSCQL